MTMHLCDFESQKKSARLFETESRTFVRPEEIVGKEIEIDDFVTFNSKKYGKQGIFIGFDDDKYTTLFSETVIDKLMKDDILNYIATHPIRATIIRRASYKNPHCTVYDIA